MCWFFSSNIARRRWLDASRSRCSLRLDSSAWSSFFMLSRMIFFTFLERSVVLAYFSYGFNVAFLLSYILLCYSVPLRAELLWAFFKANADNSDSLPRAWSSLIVEMPFGISTADLIKASASCFLARSLNSWLPVRLRGESDSVTLLILSAEVLIVLFICFRPLLSFSFCRAFAELRLLDFALFCVTLLRWKLRYFICSLFRSQLFARDLLYFYISAEEWRIFRVMLCSSSSISLRLRFASKKSIIPRFYCRRPVDFKCWLLAPAIVFELDFFLPSLRFWSASRLWALTWHGERRLIIRSVLSISP